MKNRFFSNSIISILPVFFFILGCFSISKAEITVYEIDNSNLIFSFFVFFCFSYLFLNVMLSVLIIIISTINTALGLLFCIDFLHINFSSFTLLVLLIFLGLSVLINAYLIMAVHQNKKPLDQDATLAVSQTLKTYFKVVLLTLATVLVILIFSLKGFESSYVILIFCASALFLINSTLLLPLLCRLFLGHINEEKIQDDLELSFSENLTLRLNQKIDNFSSKLVWIISPIVKNRLVCFIIIFFTILFDVFIYLSSDKMLFEDIDMQDHFFTITLLCYFMLLIIRYKSYVLTFVPAITITLNYLLFSEICSTLLSSSPILMHISFIGSIIIIAIGTFSQTDLALKHANNNNNNNNNNNTDDAILNGAAKMFSMLFVSVIVVVFFLLYAVYSDSPVNADFSNLIIAAVILIFSSLCTLFPFLAFLKLALSFHKYLKKCKRK